MKSAINNRENEGMDDLKYIALREGKNDLVVTSFFLYNFAIL